MNNFVSVIVTCYNHEAYIKQCLESIEQQTYRNFELIIINDGSTDRSAEVIEAFVEQTNLEKVTFLSHENIGLVKTRNKAFDVLKGEFVLFVDSDNYLTPNFLEELVQKAQESQGDIIYTRLINPDTQREVLPLESFSLSRLFKSNFIDSCSLVRRSIIGDVRYDDYLNGKRLEDFDFFLYLITHKKANAVPCETTFFYYRVLENSMSGQARDLMLKYYQAYVHILGKYVNSYPEEVRAASDLHFGYNITLDYYNQKVNIYYSSKDETLSEDCKFSYDFAQSDQINLQFDASVDQVRIDLSELPSFYKYVHLEVKESGEILQPALTNGYFLGDYVIFANSDPQLVYDISKIANKEFTLSYELFNLTDIHATDYVANVLSEDIDQLNKELDEAFDKYTKLQSELEFYKAELTKMTHQYNTVINSRRWIIPTKIINFLRRKK